MTVPELYFYQKMLKPNVNNSLLWQGITPQKVKAHRTLGLLWQTVAKDIEIDLLELKRLAYPDSLLRKATSAPLV